MEDELRDKIRPQKRGKRHWKKGGGIQVVVVVGIKETAQANSEKLMEKEYLLRWESIEKVKEGWKDE